MITKSTHQPSFRQEIAVRIYFIDIVCFTRAYKKGTRLDRIDTESLHTKPMNLAHQFTCLTYTFHSNDGWYEWISIGSRQNLESEHYEKIRYRVSSACRLLAWRLYLVFDYNPWLFISIWFTWTRIDSRFTIIIQLCIINCFRFWPQSVLENSRIMLPYGSDQLIWDSNHWKICSQCKLVISW